MTKQQPYPPIDTAKLLPKDKKLLEWLEKDGRPGGEEDFLNLLKLAVRTPPFKLKSSQASHKRPDGAKDRT